MAQFPTPPASRHGSELPDVDTKDSPVVDSSSAELLQSLDALLERYLDLLDRHQKLHADLAKQLSSGFLSLAQANYTCPPGRRYGADYYDERMKATRRILLEPHSPRNSIPKPESDPDESVSLDHFRHIFIVEPTTCRNRQTDEDEGMERGESDKDSPQGSQSTSESEDKDDSDTTKAPDPSEPPEPGKSTGSKERKASRKKFRSLDPITWYGILVPPALRSAQKSFTDAVEGQVPELASVVDEMQAVEREVHRLRHQLGEE